MTGVAVAPMLIFCGIDRQEKICGVFEMILLKPTMERILLCFICFFTNRNPSTEISLRKEASFRKFIKTWKSLMISLDQYLIKSNLQGGKKLRGEVEQIANAGARSHHR